MRESLTRLREYLDTHGAKSSDGMSSFLVSIFRPNILRPFVFYSFRKSPFLLSTYLDSHGATSSDGVSLSWLACHHFLRFPASRSVSMPSPT